MYGVETMGRFKWLCPRQMKFPFKIESRYPYVVLSLYSINLNWKCYYCWQKLGGRVHSISPCGDARADDGDHFSLES